jgi:hypothetical protein
VSTSRSASTGIEGLDDILSGGLERGRLFLLEGSPGTGKTTISLQFLLEGLKTKQRALYVTLSETREELMSTAASHGWELGNEVEIFELQPPESVLDPEEQQSILYASDLELWRDHAKNLGGDGACQSIVDGPRQPFRDSSPGTEFFAVPAPASGAGRRLFCSTISRLKRSIRPHTPLRTACCGSRSSLPTTGPTGEG